MQGNDITIRKPAHWCSGLCPEVWTLNRSISWTEPLPVSWKKWEALLYAPTLGQGATPRLGGAPWRSSAPARAAGASCRPIDDRWQLLESPPLKAPAHQSKEGVQEHQCVLGPLLNVGLLLAEELFGYAGAFGSIFRIPGCSHGFSVLGREHGAAYECFSVGDLLAQKFDGLFHGLHRGGHQR